ncbi:MAG: Hsp70 family protein [Planctomycetota bacterium]|nr:Hsp70 family protein [Planctomycetota bacterium]
MSKSAEPDRSSPARKLQEAAGATRRVCPVGVDLGTSSAKVATPDAGGAPRAISSAGGDPWFHSGVFVDATDDPLFGELAEEEGLRQPSGYIPNVKELRSKGEKVLGRFFPHELDRMWLCNELIPACSEQTRESPTHAVLTYPCAEDDKYRASIIKAVEDAGIIVVGTVSESTAAIIWAVTKKVVDLQIGDLVILVDIGAGTTDVSIGRYTSDGTLEIIAADGLKGHGGRKLVAEIVALVLERASKQIGTKVEPDKLAPDAKHHLFASSQKALHSLGQRDSARVQVIAAGKSNAIEVKTVDLKRILDEFMKLVAELITRVMLAAKVDPASVRQVLCTGGPTRNGLTRESLAALTKLPVVSVPEPQSAVAFGALIHCQALLAANGALVGGLPAHAVKTTDCTTKDLSIGVQTRTPGSEPSLVCACIAPSGSPIPFKTEHKFALERADQSTLRVVVLQGREGQQAANCTVLGEALFHNLPVELVKTGRIRVQVEISTHNLAVVTVTDGISGQSKTLSVKF